MKEDTAGRLKKPQGQFSHDDRKITYQAILLCFVIEKRWKACQIGCEVWMVCPLWEAERE